MDAAAAGDRRYTRRGRRRALPGRRALCAPNAAPVEALRGGAKAPDAGDVSQGRDGQDGSEIAVGGAERAAAWLGKPFQAAARTESLAGGLVETRNTDRGGRRSALAPPVAVSVMSETQNSSCSQLPAESMPLCL